MQSDCKRFIPISFLSCIVYAIWLFYKRIFKIVAGLFYWYKAFPLL